VIDAFLQGLRETSAPEVVSVAFGLLYVVLAVMRTRWCWVAGFVSSAILLVLSWEARLPMQALLQGYYVGMAVYGFWHWSREAGNAKPAVTFWPVRMHVLAIGGVVALSLASAFILSSSATRAAWPFLDSLTMWGSLLATWLTAQVKVENWLYWIVFNAIGVFLYATQGLIFVAGLLITYLVISVVGFVTWLRSRRVLAPTV
jgi:nicotinamide mononucleotide transporter